MNYTFSQLNDKEFEVLVCDLLSAVFGKRFERFKPGKDGGVDGRLFSGDNNETILQIKHYLKTGYDGLISNLTNNEIKKAIKLKPVNYIFATSLPLSRNNKKEIRTIFKGIILRDDQIYGQEDLNDILARNSDIEEKHFKLWISSTNVFNRILNNAIKGRSEYELEQIKNRSFKYIQTTNHEKALKILAEKHVIIISGEPGVGKTTLAENLCLFYSSKEFEFLTIEESLSEAENLYKIGHKQVFYFDDFLGSNYFEAIENKKDSHIVKFIQRISNDDSKRFILTSRTNILNSGILHSPIFSNQKLNKNEFMLTIDSLNDFDKAKILYNHIWFSSLPNEYIDKIYDCKNYYKIIKHKNFNPRLIEFITDIDRIPIADSSKYWKYIEETLENPKGIWNDCFKIQNNEYVRNLVKLTVFNGGTISESELRTSFNHLNQIGILKNPSHTEKDFNSISQLATRSFLNRTKEKECIKYDLFNPSIADFVINEYCHDVENITNVVVSLGTHKAIYRIDSLINDRLIAKEHAEVLRNSLFNDVINNKKDTDFTIAAIYPFKDDKSKLPIISKIIQSIIDDPKPINDFSKLIEMIDLTFSNLNIIDYNFLVKAISKHYPDHDELLKFANFIETHSITDECVIEELIDDVTHDLTQELDQRIVDIDMSEYVSEAEYDEEYGYTEEEWNSKEIKNAVKELIEEIIAEYDSKLISQLEINTTAILDEVDVDELAQNHLKSLKNDRPESRSISQVDHTNSIDDLFERN